MRKIYGKKSPQVLRAIGKAKPAGPGPAKRKSMENAVDEVIDPATFDPTVEALKLAHLLFGRPEVWLAHPNEWFDGRRPIDLLYTSEAMKVFNLLNAADRGYF